MPRSIMDARRVEGGGRGGGEILADKQSNKTKQSKTKTTDGLFP